MLFRSLCTHLIALACYTVLGFQQEQGLAGAVSMLGVRLINPPHFKNDHWEEGSAGRCSHPVSSVCYSELCTGVGRSPPCGTPWTLARPGSAFEAAN